MAIRAVYVANIVQGFERMRGLLADLPAYISMSSEPVESGESVDLDELMDAVRHDLKLPLRTTRP